MFKRSSSSERRRRASLRNPNDDAELAKLGYQAQLPRHLSMISVLGLSFAIMAVPLGLSTGLYISLTDGQSVTVFWGWIVVSMLSLAIAASLAEICAVFPTSGGVYYWSAMLATREWAPITSWITGWLTLIGNWTVTLSINFSFAQLILGGISVFNDSYVPKPWQTVLMFWAVMLVVLLVNVFMARWLDTINQICIYWTSASIIIFFVVLFAKAKTLRSGEFVFGHYDASVSGWPSGWAFFVGLLQASYTLTGYGMVAAMCEEVQNPSKEVPKAIVLSVAAAGITGILYLIPLLFTLPDIKAILAITTNQPIGYVFKTATGSVGAGFGLLFLVYGIAFFSGVGSLTAASRCTYAFARDGAIPGSKLWSQISPRFEVPLWGLLLSTAICCALSCIYFGSSAAFNSFIGVATLALSASYGLPILVLVIRRRTAVKESTFSLGRFGFFINITTICWITLAIFIFCMPVAVDGLDASNMNYASVVFSGFAIVSVIYYFVHGRKNFKGPRILQERDAQQLRNSVLGGIGGVISVTGGGSNAHDGDDREDDLGDYSDPRSQDVKNNPYAGCPFTGIVTNSQAALPPDYPPITATNQDIELTTVPSPTKQ